jgi:hypothetical protein
VKSGQEKDCNSGKNNRIIIYEYHPSELVHQTCRVNAANALHYVLVNELFGDPRLLLSDVDLVSLTTVTQFQPMVMHHNKAALIYQKAPIYKMFEKIIV